jgi:hypothetical protein
MIETGEYATVREIAEAEGVNPSYVSRVLRLTLLGPEVVNGLLEGRVADGALAIELLLEPFPVNWRKQFETFSNLAA